jgi:hypothetical protein
MSAIDDQFALIRGAMGNCHAQKGNLLSSTKSRSNMKRNTVIAVAHRLCLVIGLLALSSRALANDVEPALPGSVEYWLISNNFTWVRTSDPIGVGGYVEDLISDSRSNQPVGRGKVGIVTEIGWDPWPYDQWAAIVDFGRDFSVGIVFSELSAIQIVSIPEPSTFALTAVAAALMVARCRKQTSVMGA